MAALMHFNILILESVSVVSKSVELEREFDDDDDDDEVGRVKGDDDISVSVI